MGRLHRENRWENNIEIMATPNITSRIKEDKSLLLDHLEKTPIVQIACEKSGVGRSTYYRWLQSDPVFAKKARKALQRWVFLMNDVAESQLLKGMKDGNMTAIIFWLKSRHSAYGMKLEIVDTPDKELLTKAQKETIARVLRKYKN